MRILIDKGFSKNRSSSSLSKEKDGIHFRFDEIQTKQIDKLKEENEDLKAKIKQLMKNKANNFDGQKSHSPLATFSPLKEAVSEAAIYVQPSLTETKDPVSHKLNEVGQRLLSLMMKLGCNVDRYRNTDYGTHELKDMIDDLQLQCEDLMNGPESYS